MDNMYTRLPVFLAAMLLAATQVYSVDIAEGEIQAFDRKANILVFNDKTVWPLEKMKSELSADLKAGNRVEIQYDSSEEEGVTEIFHTKLLSQ